MVYELKLIKITLETYRIHRRLSLKCGSLLHDTVHNTMMSTWAHFELTEASHTRS